jgi:hypothetical protein
MAIDPDPYRTLGLARGATREEVKRAYRRLAKIHHPDAAGEAALPRFLAIQAAYDQLLGGAAPGVPPNRSAGRSRSWEADPDRAGATRRAYGGRGRTTPPGTSRTSGASGTTGPTGPTGATDGPTGATDGRRAGSTRGAAGRTRSQGAASPGGTRGRTRRPASGAGDAGRGSPNASAGAGRSSAPGGRPSGDGDRRRRSKATLGSTSYDDAEAGPFEPDWSGANWYGTTSGTYWTLNPKEYADPRKHGPEYQARARRATWGRGADADSAPAADDGVNGGPPLSSAQGQAGAAGSSARATHTTSSWWESTAGGTAAGASVPPPGASDGPRRREAGTRSATDGIPPPDLGRAASDIGRALTDEYLGGIRGRAARAVVGWLPIAFGLGWLFGEITGCGRFAATCDGAAEPMLLALQVGVLGVLLAVPALASAATMAALALLGAATVAALILSATGAAADGESRRATLGAVLLVAWLVGLAVAVMRRLRTLSNPGRPVS